VKRTGMMAARALAGLGVATGLGLMTLIGGQTRATAAASGGPPSAVARPAFNSAVTVSTQPLTAGCNELIYTNLPVGGKVSDWISANISPASAAVGAWHFDNPSQHYKAMWFSNPQAPVDQATFTSATDAFYVCVNASATAP
jgi:hypothetical protein